MLRRRAQSVEPAPVVPEEGADLDAVAGERRDGRRRHRAGLRRPARLPAAAAAGARRGAPDEQDEEDGDDEERDAAPAPQLALALGGAAAGRPPVLSGRRLDGATTIGTGLAAPGSGAGRRRVIGPGCRMAPAAGRMPEAGRRRLAGRQAHATTPEGPMTTDLDLLRDLCAAPAPTGFEAPVQDLVRRRICRRCPSHRATRWATSGARWPARARPTSSSPRTPTRSVSSSPTWTSMASSRSTRSAASTRSSSPAATSSSTGPMAR